MMPMPSRMTTSVPVRREGRMLMFDAVAISHLHADHVLGLPVLLALCGGLIERSIKGGLIVVGALNLGGSVEMIPNPVAVAELAVEKGALQLLMPISSRRQLFDLPDDLATKITIDFYSDASDAFLKAIVE